MLDLKIALADAKVTPAVAIELDNQAMQRYSQTGQCAGIGQGNLAGMGRDRGNSCALSLLGCRFMTPSRDLPANDI
jgi:hypothetical protein